MFKKIDHIEIIVKDLERSLAFYQEVLGFELQSREQINSPIYHQSALITQQGIKLELLTLNQGVVFDENTPSYGVHMVALAVDDLAETLEKLANKGVFPSWGPKLLQNGIRAEILDSEGNSFELRQWLNG